MPHQTYALLDDNIITLDAEHRTEIAEVLQFNTSKSVDAQIGLFEPVDEVCHSEVHGTQQKEAEFSQRRMHYIWATKLSWRTLVEPLGAPRAPKPEHVGNCFFCRNLMTCVETVEG